jgi:hypothetical protein
VTRLAARELGTSIAQARLDPRPPGTNPCPVVPRPWDSGPALSGHCRRRRAPADQKGQEDVHSCRHQQPGPLRRPLRRGRADQDDAQQLAALGPERSGRRRPGRRHDRGSGCSPASPVSPCTPPAACRLCRAGSAASAWSWAVSRCCSVSRRRSTRPAPVAALWLVVTSVGFMVGDRAHRSANA